MAKVFQTKVCLGDQKKEQYDLIMEEIMVMVIEEMMEDKI